MSFFKAVLATNSAVERPPAPSWGTKRWVATAVVGLLLVGVCFLAVHDRARTSLVKMINDQAATWPIVSTVVPENHNKIPPIDTSSMTEAQKQFLAVVTQEFNEQPPGTKYSQGVEEAWCADYVSWVRRELGYPMKNPHSGSWRIPGVYTLHEYLQTQHPVHQLGSGYEPKMGDIMLYDVESRFGRHTNFVLKVEGDYVYTIGGNEWNSIRVDKMRLSSLSGFIGVAQMDLK